MFLQAIGFPVWTLFIALGALVFMGFRLPFTKWCFRNQNAAISLIVTVVSVQLIKFSGAPNIETYYFLCTFALAVLTFIYLDTIFSGFVGAVSLLYLSNNLDITTYNQSRLTLEALCVIGILLCGKVGPDRGVFLSAWFLRLLQSLRIRTGGLSPHWLTSRFSSVPSQSDTLERDESATRFNRDARW